MKSTLALLAVAASCASVHAHAGHAHHQHMHFHEKRVPNPTVDIVPGPTVTSYVLNGLPISVQEVREGIANGTLVWANGAPAVVAQPSSYPASTASPTSVWSSSTSSWSSPSAAWSPPASQQSSAPSSGGGSGVDTPFPSGQLSCDTFPSDYGAVPAPWLGLGGWTGIQNPGSNNGGFSDIETLTSGGSCGEGMFCSYACPPGYQKSQWPSTQGATGQSVGGIQCSNGKLELTNPGLANTLCISGDSPVNVQVQNTLGQSVAVCRTDYPGTESETIALNCPAGGTQPLTCPNAATYYTWQGAHTSAQYYVNPAGVSVSDACTWGSSANPWGNWAPLNIGVGYSNGAAWLSIFQNAPTTSASLDFSVEIQGENMSGTCRYSNGQYCGGANYDQCSSTTGCTVSCPSLTLATTN